jgi:transposase
MEKIDYRTLTTDSRLEFRKQAIKLIDSGKKQKEIAEYLGVRQATLSQWKSAFKKQGLKGLREKKRGVNSEDKKLLSTEQEKTIQKMIVDKMPDQLKLDFALWTRKAVKELVEREFGVVLAINTMGDYLRKWGFSPQKPKKKAYEQDDKKVQKWLKEEYPQIEKQAKDQDAEIHWGDETGVKNQCNHGRSYAPKGQTPVKKSMALKFSVNMISSITNQGKVQFLIYTDKMNAEKFIQFMQQLIKTSSKKIFFIVDNLRVHHSKIVKEWIEENKDKIELFYLPSYSPERNPDEYLNCDLKQGLSNKKAPKNKETLEQNMKNHMEMLTKNQNRVKLYFKHKDIQYAA